MAAFWLIGICKEHYYYLEMTAQQVCLLKKQQIFDMACFNAKCFILRLLWVCYILSTCQFSEKCDIESIWMTVIGANQLAKREDEIISSKLFSPFSQAFTASGQPEFLFIVPLHIFPNLCSFLQHTGRLVNRFLKSSRKK